MLTKNFISSEEGPSHSFPPYSPGLRAFLVPPPSCSLNLGRGRDAPFMAEGSRTIYSQHIDQKQVLTLPITLCKNELYYLSLRMPLVYV